MSQTLLQPFVSSLLSALRTQMKYALPNSSSHSVHVAWDFVWSGQLLTARRAPHAHQVRRHLCACSRDDRAPPLVETNSSLHSSPRWGNKSIHSGAAASSQHTPSHEDQPSDDTSDLSRLIAGRRQRKRKKPGQLESIPCPNASSTAHNSHAADVSSHKISASGSIDDTHVAAVSSPGVREQSHSLEHRSIHDKDDGQLLARSDLDTKAVKSPNVHEVSLHDEQGLQGATAEEIENAREKAVLGRLAQKSRWQEAMDSDTGPHVVVECGFINSSLVKTQELRSLARQLEICAGVNRKHASPVKLSYTSFSGDLAVFAGRMHARFWKAHQHMEPVHELALDPSKVIVLSPDADQELLHVEDDRVYVIGGIVDRTVQKHVTTIYAQRHGFQVRKLPMEGNVEFLGQGERHIKWNILNVDSVLLALLEYRRSGNWQVACSAAISERRRRLIQH